jgi:hypothetical protein
VSLNLSSPEAALDRWKLARRRAPGDPVIEADLYGFFQPFRPDGAGLEDVFAGTERGSELLELLLEVFRVTARGWDPNDAYFLVKAPQPLTQSETQRLARLHRDSMAHVAELVGAPHLTSFLEMGSRVAVVDSVASTAPAKGANLELYEAAVDLMANLPRTDCDVTSETVASSQ